MRPGSAMTPCKKRALFRGFFPRPRTRFSATLISAADAVINEYRRSDAPTVTEKEWIRAHDVLARALRDRSARPQCPRQAVPNRRSSEPYSRHRRGDRKLLNDARGKFEQAAELIPRHPIPILAWPASMSIRCTMWIAPKTRLKAAENAVMKWAGASERSLRTAIAIAESA